MLIRTLLTIPKLSLLDEETLTIS